MEQPSQFSGDACDYSDKETEDCLTNSPCRNRVRCEGFVCTVTGKYVLNLGTALLPLQSTVLQELVASIGPGLSKNTICQNLAPGLSALTLCLQMTDFNSSAGAEFSACQS